MEGLCIESLVRVKGLKVIGLAGEGEVLSAKPG
ncbi:hypothetical protein U2A404260014 [Corynebacterium striatum]|nr:hypothetical protein U2A404260014 [Corynebacterium striatum]